MNPTLTLYHTPLHPACRKIRLMLLEKELDHQLIEEDPWARRIEFFRLNPAGDVPVLLTDKKEPICSAYAIAEWLEETYPEVQFFGNSAAERAEVRRLSDWFDSKFEREVSSNILFEKVFKRLYGYGGPNTDALRAGKHNLKYHFDYLDYLLSSRNWLAGEYLTLADITAAAHLSCLDYLGDIDWSQSEKVKEWYALVKSRPSFRAILEDRITGFRPPAHYADPDF